MKAVPTNSLKNRLDTFCRPTDKTKLDRFGRFGCCFNPAQAPWLLAIATHYRPWSLEVDQKSFVARAEIPVQAEWKYSCPTHIHFGTNSKIQINF